MRVAWGGYAPRGLCDGITKAPVAAGAKTKKEFCVNEQRQKLLAHNAKPVNVLPLIKEGRMSINAQMAAYLISDEINYPRQRPIKMHHVKGIVDKMLTGAWVSGHSINFAKLGDRLFLVNGQHRLKAITLCGKRQEFNVCITPVRSMDEVHKLYCTFDTGTRARSASEILNAAGVSERTGLSKTIVKALCGSAVFIEMGMDQVNYQQCPKVRNHDYRIECAYKWADTAKNYEQAINAAEPFMRQKLLTQGVMAVGLVTFRHQPEFAVAFWRGLADDNGLRVGDPRHTLSRDLRSRHLTAGTVSSGAKASSIAWNAYLNRRSIKRIHVIPGSELVIAGTPWG